ncbi:MAG: hypothetical protein A3G33_01900 [Omnitrophica bacterium RIFCSPLOWO2_12_FULL_44_17]|uniref:Zinc-ribbon domain-containing protein n=1 Tax=Candidatus Danuiimicrobium aquiferis TaxID=1801832 RepID=A0A1G1KTK0_9BACT|nr:MAG: hypothetical protein A3B72_04010 [Omnitrophica bacterium RIFCSPHIGHO2_02_FULL_45_28]OGW96092.1 MAG: hypothetical protein A3G33_01900 [Omnitrophica bacterium RIFCSPLOWO2_12_FULL_44_17]OGX02397.1 MAG: hypothetical protein A3J12_05645 [Omnitrophica bacterium RIFCSPLOWO2_02_FULL_44_11]
MKKFRFLFFSIFFIFISASDSAHAYAPVKKMNSQQIIVERYKAAVEEILKRADRFKKELAQMSQQRAGLSPFQNRRNSLGQMGLIQHNAILFKSLEQSLRSLIAGGILYLKKENPPEAERLLKNATDSYAENAAAHLLYGDILAEAEKTKDAAREYLAFCQSLEQPDRLGVRQKLFNLNDAKIITFHVRSQLTAQGITPPEEKVLISRLTQADFKYRLQVMMENTLTFTLPFLVIGGITFLILRRLFGIESSVPTEHMFYHIYLVIFFCYLLWIGHLFLNLPPLFRPIEWEIFSLLLAGTLIAIIVKYLRQIWHYEKERRNSESLFCPYCKKAILKIACICPFCNHKVTPEKV